MYCSGIAHIACKDLEMRSYEHIYDRIRGCICERYEENKIEIRFCQKLSCLGSFHVIVGAFDNM